ncbi:hypothetical protein [uncultured Enterococcus sp.]|uniref:hypothetical protein n=1 Tax=uncultured Enterococcus sp. TaxID=167972 RepID=UPI002AA7776C|nr:hypothetical protein [uncultured Enterococcus sp.]
MKKIMVIEERNRQQVYRILNELSQRMPLNSSDTIVFDLYIQQYEKVVNRLFSAHVFYRGMHHACSVYKHLVKVEYSRFCSLIIQKIADDSIREQLLCSMRKKRNHLLKASPSESKLDSGFEIFYGVTGGFRKKYKKDRKVIEQMCNEIEEVVSKPFYPVYYWSKKIARFSDYLKKRLLWQLRSCIRE